MIGDAILAFFAGDEVALSLVIVVVALRFELRVVLLFLLFFLLFAVMVFFFPAAFFRIIAIILFVSFAAEKMDSFR